MTHSYLIDQRDPRIFAVELAAIEFSWKRPDSLVVDEPGWFQVSTPSSREFFLNGVAFSAVSGVSGVERIQRTIREFRKRRVSFRWSVGPSSRPRDLDQILLAEGMKRTHECLGMVRTTDLSSLPSLHPSITVERVGPGEIASYASACALGWSNPESLAESIAQDMRRSISFDGNKIQYFLARVEGRPAGTGVLCVSSASGYLKGTSVIPSERGKGVYRALLQYRVSILQRLNIPIVTVQAISDSSAPICRKFGFEQVCSILQYQGE
jgi:hypothetical protein